MNHVRWRLGLRARVALAFAVVVVLVTGVLSALTWQLASSYGLEQRERAAAVRASVDAQLVRQTLRFRPDELDTLLAGLGGDADASVLVRRDGRWLPAGRAVRPEVVPPGLLATAGTDRAQTARVDADGVPSVAAVIALAPGGDVLVELVSLTELRSTLGFLATLLAAGTLGAGVLGAVLGRWTSRRALRPLDDLRAAASRVARGDLGARLPDDGDPDLAPLAATFNATVDELAERVRRDARFAGDVSHELRSPLTTLLGAADLLRRRRGELGPEAAEAVDLLGPELHRFADMVADLLEISRLEQPLDERDLERVDLAGLVEAVATRHDPPGPEIERSGHGRAPVVLADRRRLDRAVSNLWANADRHGGGVVRVATGVAGDRARIEVDDAGPGIDPEQRERIFERFHRGRAAGNRTGGTGSGLGLALVAGHVRLHGGTVVAHERPGGGARMIVELPLAAAQEGDGEARRDQRQIPLGEHRGMVDDAPRGRDAPPPIVS